MKIFGLNVSGPRDPGERPASSDRPACRLQCDIPGCDTHTVIDWRLGGDDPNAKEWIWPGPDVGNFHICPNHTGPTFPPPPQTDGLFSRESSGLISWVGPDDVMLPVVALHRFLQGLAEDGWSDADDLLDITSPDPSVRICDHHIVLNWPNRIHPGVASHLQDGEVRQAVGPGEQEVWRSHPSPLSENMRP